MEEKFAIPCVGAIIEKCENGQKYILIQKRKKRNEKIEFGLWEIPAGKIREYENIYEALRREIKEETNLDIVYVKNENKCKTINSVGYTLTDIYPFNIVQNMSGGYSIIVMIFLCRAEGEIVNNVIENEMVQWKNVKEVQKELMEFPEHFYPMHILTLKKYFSYLSLDI
ncbi:NUDIX domain-containing protein [Lachnospiraceae bacterium BSM-380-WT-5A]|uniref:NUDIX domain-containing protein n=1 Tax=Oliverpabstia intestinalis TaxID=2606633 RepID=A0A7X2P6J2_9FIRM|nr:NUDIX domain-containing protein [Oliverpabstia intestinalis]MST67932.1 NUDIX domain-containing protein [Oliverpabstia intestinalis]